MVYNIFHLFRKNNARKGSIMTTFAIFIFVVLIGLMLYFLFFNFSYSSKIENHEESEFNEKLTNIFNSLLGDKKDALPSTSSNVKRKKTMSCMSADIISASYDSQQGFIINLSTNFDKEDAIAILKIKDSRSIEISEKIPIKFSNKVSKIDTSILSNSNLFRNLSKPLDLQLNLDGCKEYSFYKIK